MYFLAEKIDSGLMKKKRKELTDLLNSREIIRKRIIHYKKNHNARRILRNNYVISKLNWKRVVGRN